MNRRRLILAAILFMLAGTVLVLLNRYTFIFTMPVDSGQVKRATNSSLPVVEFYDAKTGQRSGKLAAGAYQTQPDGTIQCQDVSLDLAGTDFGDVTLTCREALVRLDQTGAHIAGKVTLSGDVSTAAVKDGLRSTASFDKAVYDATTKSIAIEGPLDVRWEGGVKLSGKDLSGSQYRFTIARDVVLEIAGPLVGERWPRGKGADMKISCNGAMSVEAPSPQQPEGVASFEGGVRVSQADFATTAERLEVRFSARDAGESKPREWDASSIEARGGVQVSGPDLLATGERVLYEGEGYRMRIEGAPARVTYRGDWFECGSIDARLREDGAIQSVGAEGPGKAQLASVAMPEVIPGRPMASGPVAVSWKDSLKHDAGRGTVSLEGDVEARQGDCVARASRCRIQTEGVKTEEAGSGEVARQPRRLAGFDATGAVSGTDGANSVGADFISYDPKSGELLCEGPPAVIRTPQGQFESRSFTYSAAARILSSKRECRVEIPRGPSSGDETQQPRAPTIVIAGQGEADFSGPKMKATCSKGVKIESEEGILTCGSIEIEGDAMAAGGDVNTSTDSLTVKAAKGVKAKGRSDVRFTREALSASGDSFELDEDAGTVMLGADEGRRVEISYGESATVWADSAFIDARNEEVVCEKPQVVLTAKDILMGFLPDEPKKRAGGEKAMVKVYLKSGGKMALTKPAADKALLTFDGGVDGVKRYSDARQQDTVSADTLSFDMGVKPAGKDSGKKALPETWIDAVRASGNVHLKYSAGEKPLECWGKAFGWERAAARGRLAGSPAVIVRGDAPGWEADEFIYDFVGNKIVVHGGGKGSLTVER